MRTDQRRVQRLIRVRLGHRDVVLEPARDRLVHLVDDAERRIAVLHRRDDDANREKVIDLIQGFVLIDHLLVDAEDVLDSAVDLPFDAGCREMLPHFGGDLLDEVLALRLARFDLADELFVDVGLQVFQGEVVQFHLDLRNAEARGDRRIDVQRLLGDPLLLLRRHVPKGPHVVQAVRQLDQDDPDVLRHGEEHLAQVHRLHLFLLFRAVVIIAGKFEFGQLGDAVHEKGHVLAELIPDLLVGHDRVFHDVMQKARDDGLFVKFEVREDHRDVERMNDIWFARPPHLSFVRLPGGIECLLDQADIVRRVIPAHALDQVLIELLRADEFAQVLDAAAVIAEAVPGCRDSIVASHFRGERGGDARRYEVVLADRVG